ncbi:MAG: sigma-70 family RNA polymerase sigma factor [Anaerolineales bacterium]
MAEVVAGNTAALEALYDQYAPAVMGVALRIVQDHAVAEEIVQETFWRVWKNAGGFQRERGQFSGWLFAIARNIAIDRLRKVKTQPQISMDQANDQEPPLEKQPDLGMNVAEAAFTTIKHKQVRSAIQMLPQEQSQVIQLAYFQGLSRQEIAEALKTPLGTVHTRARLALQKLRSLLIEKGFEE